MNRNMSWRRPMIAVGGGIVVALLIRGFVDSGRGALFARDLATGIGFPVDTTTDVGHPWAVALIAMGAAWTIWLCLELRSLLHQFGLLLAALALCLTGSWLAHIGGGAFPTVPVMAALCLAFILGQFAAGFGGSPRQQALLGLLDGKLEASRARGLVGTEEEPASDAWRDCLVTAIEVPAGDRAFFPVLRQGLLTQGAFLHERDDGIWLAIHGLWDDYDENTAWAALARAVESLVARPAAWKLATGRGKVRRLLDLGEPASLHLRGRAIGEVVDLLAEWESADDGQTRWIASVAPPADGEAGWRIEAGESPPCRLIPTGEGETPASGAELRNPG